MKGKGDNARAHVDSFTLGTQTHAGQDIETYDLGFEEEGEQAGHDMFAWSLSAEGSGKANIVKLDGRLK